MDGDEMKPEFDRVYGSCALPSGIARGNDVGGSTH
jgi:hypothetical protein